MQWSKVHSYRVTLLILIISLAAEVKAESVELRLWEAIQSCRLSISASTSAQKDRQCSVLKQLLEPKNATWQIDGPQADITNPVVLLELESIVSDYLTPPRQSSLELSRIEKILSETLVSRPPKPKSLWEQFIEWLNTHHSSGKSDWNWLKDLLQKLVPSKALASILFKGVVVATILLAVAIVANEYRYSDGFKFWRRSKFKRNSNMEELDQSQSGHSIDRQEIEKLPLHEQPVNLLNWVINEMIAKDILPDNRSFTNLEFCQVIRPLKNVDTAIFSDFMNTIDKIVYGNEEINRSTVNDLSTQACQVVDSLAVS